jgi:hypothetical protein
MSRREQAEEWIADGSLKALVRLPNLWILLWTPSPASCTRKNFTHPHTLSQMQARLQRSASGIEAYTAFLANLKSEFASTADYLQISVSQAPELI